MKSDHADNFIFWIQTEFSLVRKTKPNYNFLSNLKENKLYLLEYSQNNVVVLNKVTVPRELN